MKKVVQNSSFKFLILLSILFVSSETLAQFGRGGMGNNGMNGMRRSTIPQAQEAPKEPEPKTAEDIVSEQMPSITEALGLNDFENAVVSSILKKYVQERIEAQILKLPPEKMREVYENIAKRQDEELESGLPPEKFEAFLALREDGISKTLKKKKKQKRKKPKN